MDAQSNPSELIGAIVNERYRILRVLGEGGMGKVYEAEHTLLGSRVALKTLLPGLTRDPDLAQRFKREARAASSIGHEHIVSVTDMGQLGDGSPYLVMEMLDGAELADLIDEQGPLPIGRAVRIVRKVCSAVSAAHGAGIVHRDLKPANVFLVHRADGVDFPKVLDFGISKLTGGSDQGLTATGAAIGTPAYMSPEQAQGLRSVDHRTDIYAVGAILYETLTGRRPLEAPSHASLLIKILLQEPDPPSRSRPDLPSELDAIVGRALAKDPNERFQTMDALAAALAPFESMDAMPETRGAPRPEARPAQDTRILEEKDDEASPEPATEIGEPSVAVASPSVHTAPELPRREVPWAMLGGLTAAAAALLGVGVWAMTQGEAPTDAEPRPAPASATEVTPGLDAPPSGALDDAPPVAPAPAEVRVRIRVVPPDARVYLGDVEYPNPMDAHHPRSTDPVPLRVEAEGHTTIERPLIFDDDLTLELQMSRGRPGRSRGRASSTRDAPARERPEPAERGGVPDPGVRHEF